MPNDNIYVTESGWRKIDRPVRLDAGEDNASSYEDNDLYKLVPIVDICSVLLESGYLLHDNEDFDKER